MNPTEEHYQEEILTKYMNGKIQLKDIRKMLGLTQHHLEVILEKLFYKPEILDSNFLYDKRMSEVEQIRRENFTEAEIATQQF